MAELRVVRHTDRFADGCRFYGDMLGWPVTKSWEDPAPGRVFGFGDSARVELLSVDSASCVPATGVALSVEVADVTAVHARLDGAGIGITQPLADQPWGHRNFGVVDPTGLPVVFFEVMP